MTKILLALCGAALLAVPSLQAQGSRSFGGSGARPSAVSGGRSYAGHSYGGRGYYGHGGYYGGHRFYGRNYYLGGIGYYYPFYGAGFGFGYPYYGYNGFADGYYGGPYGYGGNGGAYEGRVTDQGQGASNEASANSGPSLPSAVQRQLSKRGFYKGSIDGNFGPASRSALSRFQRENDLKETGRIDEDTLEALGFSDHR